MSNPIEENCTHDCSTCGGSCAEHEHSCGSCGEHGEPKPSVFDHIDNIVEHLNTDEGFDMLSKIAAELEKE